MHRHASRDGARPVFAPGALRRATAGVLLLTMPLAGCYSTRVLATAPAPGTTVILDVSDQGRVALADRFGQSLERIQGKVETVTDSSLVLRIESVRYLNGQVAQWANEAASLPRGAFSRIRQQQFSRGRTFGLVAGVVTVLVAVILNTDLIGGGSGAHTNEPSPGGSGGT